MRSCARRIRTRSARRHGQWCLRRLTQVRQRLLHLLMRHLLLCSERYRRRGLHHSAEKRGLLCRRRCWLQLRRARGPEKTRVCVRILGLGQAGKGAVARVDACILILLRAAEQGIGALVRLRTAKQPRRVVIARRVARRQRLRRRRSKEACSSCRLRRGLCRRSLQPPGRRRRTAEERTNLASASLRLRLLQLRAKHVGGAFDGRG